MENRNLLARLDRPGAQLCLAGAIAGVSLVVMGVVASFGGPFELAGELYGAWVGVAVAAG